MGRGPSSGGQGLRARAGEHRGDRVEEVGVEGTCRTPRSSSRSSHSRPNINLKRPGWARAKRTYATPHSDRAAASAGGDGSASMVTHTWSKPSTARADSRGSQSSKWRSGAAADTPARLTNARGETLVGLEHLRGIGQQRGPRVAVTGDDRDIVVCVHGHRRQLRAGALREPWCVWPENLTAPPGGSNPSPASARTSRPTGTQRPPPLAGR